jgi:hypothetical protein
MKTAKKRGRPAKKQVVEQPQSEMSSSDDVVKVMVIRQCRNTTMVEARLDGEKVLVRVPKRIHAKCVGKIIKINTEPTDLGDKVIYDYIP